MTSLVDALYEFSNALLVPVIASLFVLVLYSLLEIGGSLREWSERRRVRNAWQVHQRELVARSVSFDTSENAKAVYPGLVAVFVKRTLADGGLPIFAEKHAHDVEIESSARLARLSLLIRVGPMLGLMGTLIPLGPALIGLTESNLTGMAEDLVVAFSTTVLGLLVGGVAYAIWLARRQWYAQDLADMDFLLQTLSLKEPPTGFAHSTGET
ncbi:MAG: MotA/TolQ/ExbB proton channel family protein [Planctomycetaceae bacterium]|nr:MotA/TolQ/ExbB proton channel family protein [Planctomycetaceae bacterium]